MVTTAWRRCAMLWQHRHVADNNNSNNDTDDDERVLSALFAPSHKALTASSSSTRLRGGAAAAETATATAEATQTRNDRCNSDNVIVLSTAKAAARRGRIDWHALPPCPLAGYTLQSCGLVDCTAASPSSSSLSAAAVDKAAASQQQHVLTSDELLALIDDMTALEDNVTRPRSDEGAAAATTSSSLTTATTTAAAHDAQHDATTVDDVVKLCAFTAVVCGALVLLLHTPLVYRGSAVPRESVLWRRLVTREAARAAAASSSSSSASSFAGAMYTSREALHMAVVQHHATLLRVTTPRVMRVAGTGMALVLAGSYMYARQYNVHARDVASLLLLQLPRRLYTAATAAVTTVSAKYNNNNNDNDKVTVTDGNVSDATVTTAVVAAAATARHRRRRDGGALQHAQLPDGSYTPAYQRHVRHTLRWLWFVYTQHPAYKRTQ